MIIRRASHGDEKQLVELLEGHISSCGNDYPMPDKMGVFWTIHSSFHKSSPILLNLAFSDDGELIGCACCTSSRRLWTTKYQAQIIIVYVRPDHRGSTAFIRLMREIEKWAQEKECTDITFTLASGIDDEKTVRCIDKLGYKRTGIDTVKSL